MHTAVALDVDDILVSTTELGSLNIYSGPYVRSLGWHPKCSAAAIVIELLVNLAQLAQYHQHVHYYYYNPQHL